MTQVIAINGSPRTTWNTATLLEHALEGAASEGAEIEIVHLYDLDYKGCTDCFSCNCVGGRKHGKCAVKDGLTPLLEKVANADALILGSPIYVGTATGEMRSFFGTAGIPVHCLRRGAILPVSEKDPTGFIYTMGADKGRVKDMGYKARFRLTSSLLERIFGSSEWIMVTDTLQFDDYSKYVSSGFNPGGKGPQAP